MFFKAPIMLHVDHMYVIGSWELKKDTLKLLVDRCARRQVRYMFLSRWRHNKM
jgi:hypothetical protein